MRKYSSHVCFHAFLNSLCNSGDKPLVTITIPFYSATLQCRITKVYNKYTVKIDFVILTTGLLFDSQMHKHNIHMHGYRFDCFYTFLIENTTTYCHYRCIPDVFSFLNSLCNSGNQPLVYMTIPFYCDRA